MKICVRVLKRVKTSLNILLGTENGLIGPNGFLLSIGDFSAPKLILMHPNMFKTLCWTFIHLSNF